MFPWFGSEGDKNCIVKIIISRGDNKFGYQIPNGIVPNIYFNKIRLPKYINNSLKLGISNYKFSISITKLPDRLIYLTFYYLHYIY